MEEGGNSLTEHATELDNSSGLVTQSENKMEAVFDALLERTRR